MTDVGAASGAKTIVIKLGSSSILDETTLQPKIGTLAAIVETVRQLRVAGHRVVMVSSGAIGTGRIRMGYHDKPQLVQERQALAALGQVRLITLWDTLFGAVGLTVAQILLTRADLADTPRYYNARATLETLLSSRFGAVPIVNENDTVSVSELRFGDNDSLSAITGGLVDADYLFLCTDVDGLYTDNPRRNPDARRLGVVRGVDQARRAVSVTSMGSSFGTGGMQTKLIAAELATAAGIATVIVNCDHPENIARIVARGLPETPVTDQDVSPAEIGTPPLDDPPHTVFLPQTAPLPARKWPILHALRPAGALVIDQGAFERISKKESGGRLLPAGVVGVEGNFERLQAVRLLVQRGNERDEVGRALSNYTSIECERIKGLQSSQMVEVLGYSDSSYVTDQVVLAEGRTAQSL